MFAHLVRGFVLLVAFGFAASGTARADLIVGLTGTATAVSGGYRYEYTLTNQSTAGELVFDLSIGVSPGTTLSNIASPPGWEVVYAPGDPVVEWLATPAGPTGLDNALAPGGTLVYSFTSPDAPAPARYTVLADAGGSLVQVEGVVTAAVPEPATFFVFAAAGCCLLDRLRRRPRAARP